MSNARRASWFVLLLVVVVSLFVGRGSGVAATPAERVRQLSTEFACPTCDGQAVAESNAPVATNIIREIRRQVDDGRTDLEIESYLVDRYGAEVVLTPPAGGVDGLVWVIPVVALVVSLAGLTVVFRRWSRRDVIDLAADDRQLVEDYLDGA